MCSQDSRPFTVTKFDGWECKADVYWLYYQDQAFKSEDHGYTSPEWFSFVQYLILVLDKA